MSVADLGDDGAEAAASPLYQSQVFLDVQSMRYVHSGP